MKRSNRKRHRSEEVVAKLRQADEALAKGTPIADVARSLGVSEVTLHRWRAEYGAVDCNAVRRMKELEKKNGRLKRQVADQQLDIQLLKEIARGNMSPARRRRAIECMTMVMEVPERRVFREAGQHRITKRRAAPLDPYRDRLVARMRELALEHRLQGRRTVMGSLRKEHWSVGARLKKRLWRQEGLLVPQKRVRLRRIGTGEGGIKRRRASMKNARCGPWTSFAG
jgi:transposase-like protein